MKNIPAMLYRASALWPDKSALSYKGKDLTWRQVKMNAEQLAVNLKRAGIKRGQKVAIFTDHVPAQVIGLFGVAMNDAVFTFVHRLLKEDQVKYLLTDADAAAVIGTKRYLKQVADFCRERSLPVIEMDEMGELMGECENEDNPIDYPSSIPTDVANIIYTSGSTGKAKGVVLPHRTLLDGARIVSGYLGIKNEDTILSVLPLNFDYGLNQILTAVYTGARVVMQPFTTPQAFISAIENEQVTGVAGVPSMWPNLFNEKMVDASCKPEFKSLRYLTTAGGMHTQDLLKKLSEFFPHTEIIVMYGLTESFRSTYLPFSEIFKRPGSIGKAVPEVEIMVLNEQGERCRPGERGELIHRGAFVSYGYLNNEELTKQKFTPLATGGAGCLPEMAVRSGDIVSLDEEGFIYYHSRADMQIKSSGYRISPGEVEEALLAMPDVRHAAVFGISHSDLGQIVCAAYTTYSGNELSKTEILKHMRNSLPIYAVPRRIFFREEMPFTVNGKIDYNALNKSAEESNNNSDGK
jgi:acyl-CoA synthetase (AMP-forming)/AMP-acid ligase II